MFARCSTIVYPQIPLLTVHDVWIGESFSTASDKGKLLLNIGGGPWGYAQRWVIVSSQNYCYSLYGNGRTFHPFSLNTIYHFNGPIKNDQIRWVSNLNETLQYVDGGWYIDSASYGEGNRYVVAWGSHDATATPIGPWTQEEDPPEGFTLELDWTRYGGSRAVGKFTPATTYSRNPPSGEIQTGVPSWEFVFDGVHYGVFKTLVGYSNPTSSSEESYIIVADSGEIVSRMVWKDDVYSSSTSNGNTVYGGIPQPGSTWELTHVKKTDETITKIYADWVGYVEGFNTSKFKMFEIARLL